MSSSTPRDTAAFLWDVRHASDLIRTFVRGKSFEDHTDDVLLRSAVERQFQIVGEALNRLSRADPELADRIPTSLASSRSATSSCTATPP